MGGRLLFVLLALIGPWACERAPGARPPSRDTPHLGRDIGIPGGLDMATGLDASVEEDLGLAPSVEWHRFSGDQTSFEGEWVATYDQNWWWDQRPRLHYAIFDPSAFFPFPRDESFRFLASDQVDTIETIPGRGPTYDAFLGQNGLGLRRLPLDGLSYVLAAHEGYHREENGFGDFAWDLTRTDDRGARFRSTGARNEDYFVWGKPVLAPVAGTVIEVVRDEPDNSPGVIPADARQNYVGIGVAGRYAVYLLHMQQGSIPPELVPSTPVEPGDFLGLTGNSGVTLEPHVHVVMMFFDVETERYWSVPTEFDAVRLHRGPGDPGRPCVSCRPRAGVWLSRP